MAATRLLSTRLDQVHDNPGLIPENAAPDDLISCYGYPRSVELTNLSLACVGIALNVTSVPKVALWVVWVEYGEDKDWIRQGVTKVTE